MHPPIARLIVAVALTLSLFLAPSFVGAEDDSARQNVSAAAMLFDLVALRPLGIAATILGGASFIVSLPFSALAGNMDEAAARLVCDPFRYSFERPLGHVK